MFNSILWTTIIDGGYPDSTHDTSTQICLVERGHQIYQAVWCDVSKQWLNLDHRPFCSQWKITAWAYINKPEKG